MSMVACQEKVVNGGGQGKAGPPLLGKGRPAGLVADQASASVLGPG